MHVVIHHHAQTCLRCGFHAQWSKAYSLTFKGHQRQLTPIASAPAGSHFEIVIAPRETTAACFQCPNIVGDEARIADAEASRRWAETAKRKAEEARRAEREAKAQATLEDLA